MSKVIEQFKRLTLSTFRLLTGAGTDKVLMSDAEGEGIWRDKSAAFNAIAPATTKGDLLVRTDAGMVRLPVGSNYHLLAADSSQTTGLRWSKTPMILFNQFSDVSHTGTTAQTTMASYVMPGGTMGPQGALRITHLASSTNTANTRIVRVRFGGLAYGIHSFGTNVSVYRAMVVSNRNGSESSQIGLPANITTGTSSSSPAVSSVNTSVDQEVSVTGELGVATDTIVLHQFLVELIR